MKLPEKKVIPIHYRAHTDDLTFFLQITITNTVRMLSIYYNKSRMSCKFFQG